ncbi:MAG: hypothetical protein K2G32_00720, partial [Oscillospiraceae bacterium]|nr:hypothetical protein [Oscillospiraceae bacterium]
LYINVIAVRCLIRIISVNRRGANTRGSVVKFDNVRCLTVKYAVDGREYSGECCIIPEEFYDPHLIGDVGMERFSGEVEVTYDMKKPSRFLVNSGRKFYIMRIILIFYLDAAFTGLSAIFIYLAYVGLL